MTPPDDLLGAAREVRNNAYVPYSKFKVGAALRTDRGHVFRGANVENASYGLTRCAEQSAILAMVSSGETSFTEIVVYTEAAEPASPCGACRQIMLEFSPSAAVYMVNHQGEVKTVKVSDLLPDGFAL